jgi:hypothetical protein
MRPEEARDFYEEDEDPARVFAIFDAAKRQERLGRTEPPGQQPDLLPLRELLAYLWHDLQRLRLRQRASRFLRRHMTHAVKSRTGVH